MTNMLGCKAVSGAKLFNMVCVVTERMDFVHVQVEEFHIWAIFCCKSPTAGLLVSFLCLSSPAADTSSLLTQELCCLVL